MKEVLLHAYAIAVALSILFLIPTGAVVTNLLATPSPAAVAAATGLFSPKGHQHVGELVGVLTLILVIWVLVAEKWALVRRLVWIPLVIVFVEIGLGHASGKASPTVSLLHAFLASIFLASVAALAFAASPTWRREPIMIQDRGWPPLRGLAKTALVFVILQVALGASFRHGAIGVMFHIVGALLVVLTLLGGPAQSLCGETGFGGGGTWNRDGVILFASETGSLRRVNAAGGECVAVTQPDQATRDSYPEFLPDGKHFLYLHQVLR